VIRRWTRAALIVALALVAAAGTLAATVPVAAAGPVRLSVGVVGPLGSIDLASATSEVAREVWRLQYPTLTAYSLDTLAIVPGLAEAWTPSPDGRGFVYTLRPATWSDGQPVTAEDVVFSLAQAKGQASSAGAFDELDARAVDARTVSVTTSGGLGALPALPLHVAPRAAGADGQSAGDWRVVEVNDATIRMTVIERPGRPALDEIVFRSYPDATALVDALADGDIDIAGGLTPDDYERAREVDEATVIHANDGDQWVLQLRLADADVRHAIALAIDRDALVQSAVNGVGRPEVVPVVARPADWRLPADESRRLARASAYAPGRAAELVDGADPPNTASLTLASPGDEVGQVVATRVVDALNAAGISVEQVATGTGDITIVRRDPTDDPAPVLAQYTCASGIWCDAEYDAAFAQFDTTNNLGVRSTAVHNMLRRLVAGVPEVVLFAPDQLQAFRPDHIAGILRRPEQPRLVTLWPSVEQYRGMHAAPPAASEELPAATFAALAFGLAAVIVAGVVVVDRWRVHSRR
jgi:peptide/nickel transport system substrate-binding protein